MVKETIETTKTVEETQTEHFLICDSCGLDQDEGDIHAFTAADQNMDALHFCKPCLDAEQLTPITDTVSENVSVMKEGGYGITNIGLIVSGFLFTAIAGLITSGFWAMIGWPLLYGPFCIIVILLNEVVFELSM